MLCHSLPRRSIIDRWPIELGDGGSGPIWPKSDGEDASLVVLTAFVLVALALLLSLVLAIEEEGDMPTASNKTAETPASELPFPGKLVEGKYDVQYLHL